MLSPATAAGLQSLCETGQQQLMLMDYLAAESSLLQAEQLALQLSDFDTISRLYMPLQEARRQRRQRCGEGTIQLHLLASGPNDPSINAERLIEQFPHGQLLIAGWGNIEAAIRFRELATRRRLYVETYLAAVYPVEANARVVAIVALPVIDLPRPEPRPVAELILLLPESSIILTEDQLPAHGRAGDVQTYARTMSIWERLHTPYLTAADALADPIEKMEAYRRAIAVDYACELAHQKLSAVARAHARAIR
jgi:hypothetical protein